MPTKIFQEQNQEFMKWLTDQVQRNPTIGQLRSIRDEADKLTGKAGLPGFVANTRVAIGNIRDESIKKALTDQINLLEKAPLEVKKSLAHKVKYAILNPIGNIIKKAEKLGKSEALQAFKSNITKGQTFFGKKSSSNKTETPQQKDDNKNKPH